MHYPLKETPYTLYSRVCGPPPGFDPRTVQPVPNRYIGWVLPAVRARGTWVEYKRIIIKVSFYTDTKKTMIEMNLFQSDYLLHARVRDVTGRFGKEECSGPPPHAAMLRWCARAILQEFPNLTFVNEVSFVWCCRVDTDRSTSAVAWQCIISYISAVVQKQYSIIQQTWCERESNPSSWNCWYVPSTLIRRQKT